MITFRTKLKVSLTILVFILSLILPVSTMQEQVARAERNDTQSIMNLEVGDRVVDTSWEWEFKTSLNYSGSGDVKPITWIVVAKNHYSSDVTGRVAGSHVTLMTEERIARHVFDNSTDRSFLGEGNNHYGNSGTTDATRGIRKFLNGKSYTGDDSNVYDETFYDAMSADFQKAVLQTSLPNKEWEEGKGYITNDKVFLASTTEIGDIDHTWTYEIGQDWGYFTDDESRNYTFLTRSPSNSNGLASSVMDNSFLMGYATNPFPIYPAINLSSQALVTVNPNEDGIFVIQGYEEIEIGSPGSGDVTGGGVSVSDAIEVLRYIVGLSQLSEEQKKAADVNQDEKIDVSDAITILRFIVGLVDNLPIE